MNNECTDATLTTADEPSNTTPTRESREQFFLARLQRFAGLAIEVDVPAMRRLAQHATLAAYRDCVALGLRDAALRTIEDAGTVLPPSERRRAGDML